MIRENNVYQTGPAMIFGKTIKPNIRFLNNGQKIPCKFRETIYEFSWNDRKI